MHVLRSYLLQQKKVYLSRLVKERNSLSTQQVPLYFLLYNFNEVLFVGVSRIYFNVKVIDPSVISEKILFFENDRYREIDDCSAKSLSVAFVVRTLAYRVCFAVSRIVGHTLRYSSYWSDCRLSSVKSTGQTLFHNSLKQRLLKFFCGQLMMAN